MKENFVIIDDDITQKQFKKQLDSLECKSIDGKYFFVTFPIEIFVKIEKVYDIGGKIDLNDLTINEYKDQIMHHAFYAIIRDFVEDENNIIICVVLDDKKKWKTRVSPKPAILYFSANIDIGIMFKDPTEYIAFKLLYRETLEQYIVKFYEKTLDEIAQRK